MWHKCRADQNAVWVRCEIAARTGARAVRHPEHDVHFEGLGGGRYLARKKEN